MSTIDEVQQAGFEGMHLLFAAGKRPSRAAIKKFAEATRAVHVSHDPSEGKPLHLVGADANGHDAGATPVSDESDRVWLELLRDGLTFDLTGLGPGEACEFPEIEQRFDIDRAPGAFRFETITLMPGQHLTGGGTSFPVAKGMIALARDLTHHFDELEVVVWPPARSAIGRRYFESVATAWLEGGAFPALGLTTFRETIDGALQSVGLEFWIGQELRVEPPISNDKVYATRLGVRLINQLILIGGLEESERVVAPDGARLVMRPSRNRKFIRVWPE
ncbi:MAG: hypothetical protein AAF687_05805 [Pseudomonadota bacterium]